MRVCEWDWMKCLAVNLTPPPLEPEIRWMVKVESPFFTEMQSAGFFFRTRSDETDLCPSLSLVRSRNGHSSWSLQPFKGLDIIVLRHKFFWLYAAKLLNFLASLWWLKLTFPFIANITKPNISQKIFAIKTTLYNRTLLIYPTGVLPNSKRIQIYFTYVTNPIKLLLNFPRRSIGPLKLYNACAKQALYNNS